MNSTTGSRSALFDNLGKRGRPKNSTRAAIFFPELWAARHVNRIASTGMTSVTIPTPPLPPKFRSFLKAIPRVQLHKWRTPAEWRDCCLWLEATYWHLAADEEGYPHAFSLRLRSDIEAIARQQPSAASYLQKRIASELRKNFELPVNFWFVLERALDPVSGNRHLHLHGEVVVSAADAPKARYAFRRAAGEWEVARQHQADTRPLPDEGWVGYVLKDSIWNDRRSPAAGGRGFSGEHFAATVGLRSAAKIIYCADRALVMSNPKGVPRTSGISKP